ncbi:MAG TPA: GNAT family N-acetyltransferase [Anaerolineae bacterium]|nr:GNAT family N-acetyltransferase [Anaerolineae bacterium]
MSDLKTTAKSFVEALSANSADRYAKIFSEDVSLLSVRWDGTEVYRPQRRVVNRLIEEWSTWSDPSIELLNAIDGEDQVSLEFRIQATEHDRYVEHNRSAFLKIKDGQIEQIRLYCAEPIPSARRKGWIAPANIAAEELRRVFESMMNSDDPYEWISPDESSQWSLRGGMGGSGRPHPGSNGVGSARWPAEEADRKIEEIIEYHRQRNIGFQWWVSPYDTPTDLRERLEKHGMVLAGDAVTMARLGLEAADIPINPDTTVELLDGYDLAAVDAIGEIDKVCFQWTQEQVDERKPGWIERMRDERFHDREANFLARITGRPAGHGRVILQSGIAYLGGAGVLPEFRGKKVYSTLLRRRLEYAHNRGYHIAAINAEPLSRPIVERYGFKEYSRIYIYGWMPVIDLDVIKSLVPQ